MIRQKGTQNPQYASDYDLPYGKMKELIGGSVPGLVALLKTLKKQKKVDYNDEGGFLQDRHVITAIGSDDAKQTEFIRYEDIIAKLGAEVTSHNKSAEAWGNNA